MHHLARFQLDDKESKERAEEEIRDRQEVAGSDVVSMVMQKGGPGLRRRSYTPCSHVFLDRALGDLNAQFEQLPSDTLRTPQAIVQRHRLDPSDDLGSDFGFR
jgi:hypothetical protein